MCEGMLLNAKLDLIDNLCLILRQRPATIPSSMALRVIWRGIPLKNQQILKIDHACLFLRRADFDPKLTRLALSDLFFLPLVAFYSENRYRKTLRRLPTEEVDCIICFLLPFWINEWRKRKRPFTSSWLR